MGGEYAHNIVYRGVRVYSTMSVCESNLKGFFSVVVDVDVVVVAEKLHKKKEEKKLVGTTPLHQAT
jgi:hypothetical protein